jgi:hypothetical protein
MDALRGSGFNYFSVSRIGLNMAPTGTESKMTVDLHNYFKSWIQAVWTRGAQCADMIQWREDSAAEFVALGVKATREVDQNHLLTYSTVGMQWGEEDWRYHL